VTLSEADYSPEWVGETGLDLGPGFCITFVRGVEPADALRRVDVSDADLRTSTWPELVAAADALEPAYDHYPMAAFVIGATTVLVEDNGFIGRIDEWNRPLSTGAEVVYVYQSPTSAGQELGIIRDDEEIALVDGDAIEDSEVADDAVRARLLELARSALRPWEDDGEPPVDFDEGWVDLLQVACDYVGLRPLVSDVDGPVLGAPVRIRS
jgi:hypothetical protein